MRFISIAFLLTACSLASAQSNLEIVGHLPNTTDSILSFFATNDVWAYVAPDGTEYALVGKYNGVQIVSLQDPARPQEVQFIEGVRSPWRDLKVRGQMAYVSNEAPTQGAVRAIDLSNRPGPAAVYDSILPGLTNAHNIWIEDNWLYVVGSNEFNGGIGRYNLARDSIYPPLVSSWSGNYVHDLHVRNDLVYAAEIYNASLSLVDMKSDPTLLSQTHYPGALTHSTWLNAAGNVCFTSDEQEGAYIRSWDVSDPTDVSVLDKIRISVNPNGRTPHNVHAKDDFLLISY